MGPISEKHGFKTIEAAKARKKQKRVRANLPASTRHQLQAFSLKKSLKEE